jgi:hypothetical protein
MLIQQKLPGGFQLKTVILRFNAEVKPVLAGPFKVRRIEY